MIKRGTTKRTVLIRPTKKLTKNAATFFFFKKIIKKEVEVGIKSNAKEGGVRRLRVLKKKEN